MTLLARPSSNILDGVEVSQLREVRQKNMVLGSAGLGKKNNCAREGHQQFTRNPKWNSFSQSFLSAVYFTKLSAAQTTTVSNDGMAENGEFERMQKDASGPDLI
jgi:hypothetical protein